ncbi:serine/threonine-protein phosphatase [Candidatus Gracilibacteria bacterium]|nr:serine/threonine-protein phosphatase [Candidatus Gracilibacteria bacterium]
MFKFFKKKKKNIDTSDIKNFNNILKIIEDFIIFEDFDKASKGIMEVISKENESFNYYIENIKEKEKNIEIKKFKQKLQKIEKLKILNDKKKKEYQIRSKQKKQKEEIKNLTNKVKEYLQEGNFDEAIYFVNTYLEKNSSDIKILNIGNDLKKTITKELEKYKEQKKKEIKKDTLKEAQALIGEITLSDNDIKKDKSSFYQYFKNKFNFYLTFKKKYKQKKLLDDVNLLLQSKKEKDLAVAEAKLKLVHSGSSREIRDEKVSGYDIYGKILGADKVTGDSLGISNNKKDHIFFIGDATGHGIKAGFTIGQLNKYFGDFSKKLKIENLILEINNLLKQDLKSGNFITSIFFNINDEEKNKVSFVGMGHEPIFVYRNTTKEVEKIIPGGLAAGIRLIKDISNIKKREIILNDGDILMSYTDGIVEAKNSDGEMYSIDRIGKKLKEFSMYKNAGLEEIYEKFLLDLKIFTGGKGNYLDDVTILLLKRDKSKDILKTNNQVEELLLKQNIDKKYKKKFLGKTLEEIRGEIEKSQKENALRNIIKSLDLLYTTGELTKLKTECIRYIKEGYIHKKINFYLKKAIDNESIFKQKQKNQKIRDKYQVLNDLYKKGDFETVITECSNIISKNGNI